MQHCMYMCLVLHLGHGWLYRLFLSWSSKRNIALNIIKFIIIDFLKPGVCAKGENGATPLHFAARFQVNRHASTDASEGPSQVVTPEETPKFSKKQLEGRSSGEKMPAGNTSQKAYLKPPSFGLRKRDSGGTRIVNHS